MRVKSLKKKKKKKRAVKSNQLQFKLTQINYLISTNILLQAQTFTSKAEKKNNQHVSKNINVFW